MVIFLCVVRFGVANGHMGISMNFYLVLSTTSLCAPCFVFMCSAVLVCPTWRCVLTSIRLARPLLQLALVQAMMPGINGSSDQMFTVPEYSNQFTSVHPTVASKIVRLGRMRVRFFILCKSMAYHRMKIYSCPLSFVDIRDS